MQLILIRHAETQRVEADSGAADPALTPRGEEQARQLAGWLRSHQPIDHIVTSPLRRARDTAGAIETAFALRAEIVPALAEFDAAATSYIPMEEMKATRHPRLLAMLEGRWEDLQSRTGPEDFRRSIVATLDNVAAQHPGAAVAAVCHGAVINAYLGAVIETPRFLWFEPRYTSLHRVLVSRAGVRSVETVNAVPHLSNGW